MTMLLTVTFWVQHTWASKFDPIAPYRDKYGPTTHTQNGEDWLIRDFFADKRDGVFVDVGAADYKDHSNT